MTLNSQKIERISGMFLRDMSLDFISEEGVNNGWTREDAKAVVAMKGWALDWSGRLQQRYVPRAPGSVPPHAISDANIERMISIGIDHELVEIRRLGTKAQRAVDELRRALIIQEEKDAEEVASRRRQREAERTDPNKIKHGSWGGYLQHKLNQVPVCDLCAAARDAYVADRYPNAQQAS